MSDKSPWQQIQRAVAEFVENEAVRETHLATLTLGERAWYLALEELEAEIAEAQLLRWEFKLPMREAIHNCDIRLGSREDIFEKLRGLN